MKAKSRLLIAVLLVAMISLAVQSTGVGFGDTAKPTGKTRWRITLTRDAKTNGYIVIKLSDGIEVRCQGVVVPEVSKEKALTGAESDGVTAEGKAQPGVPARRSDGAGKYGTAEAGYEATAKAGAKAEGKASLDGPVSEPPGGVGVTAKSPDQGKVTSTPRSTGGVDVTAYATVQGTVHIEAVAVAEGSARVTDRPPTVVAEGTVQEVDVQEVNFKDGNASFKLPYPDVKSVTVIIDK